MEDRTLLTSFTVTTTADGVPGSLRQVIQAANSNPGADTIVVPADTYTLTIAGTGEDAAATGDLDITDDLTVTGDGAQTTLINRRPRHHRRPDRLRRRRADDPHRRWCPR
jgi:hypothetical protein